MSKARFFFDYIRYYLSASNKHGIHSPFVFHLLTEVINARENPKKAEKIEKIRKKLKKDRRSIHIEDYGAGSKVNTSRERSISDIAKNSIKSKKYGRLLHRLAAHFQPTHLLELGTSLGISSMYLATACKAGRLTTVEGSPEIAALAKNNFHQLGIHNIELEVQQFDHFLTEYLQTHPSIDFVFFDGNHQKSSTLYYFESCLANVHNDSLFIFDDIYWSKEMTEAWEQIKLNPRVTVTIDFFFMGLVFFRKEQVKENFKIRF